MKKRKLLITEVSGTATTPVASGGQASAAANCPGGTKALGGGFSSSPTPTLGASVAFPIFWANYRTTPTTWGASMSNSGNVARTVTSYAYCASGLKISETSGSATLAASGPATSSATAAHHRRAARASRCLAEASTQLRPQRARRSRS